MIAAILTAGTSAGLAMSVSPARTEVRVPPGGTVTAVITITNTHSEAYDVELSEKPWFIYPETRAIQVEVWLKLPFRRHFRLKAGQSRDVKVTLRCPKTATGELMGMVSFTYQGTQKSMVTPMISTAVYLEVKGTEKNQAEILALGAGAKNGRFQVGAQIKATGNVRLRPSGRMHLLNDQGQYVAEYIVAETAPLFPGTIKDYEGRGPDQIPPAGHYRLTADLDSGTLHLKAERGLTVGTRGEVQMDKEATQL
jgi:hypothetical protein